MNAFEIRPYRKNLLEEIELECDSQDAKWGIQDHPDYTYMFLDVLSLDDRVARKACEDAFLIGYGSWTHIVLEELAEAVSAEDGTDMREELIQLAAVIVQWIHAIDRRYADEKPSIFRKPDRDFWEIYDTRSGQSASVASFLSEATANHKLEWLKEHPREDLS